MKFSDELNEACRSLHQDVEYYAKTEAELTEASLAGLSDKQRRKLTADLHTLLESNVTDDKLRALWWDSPSDIVFEKGADVRAFLSLLLNKLKQL